MMLQTGQQIRKIHILPNMSRSKDKQAMKFRQFPVGTRYYGDIGFLLDLHRVIDRLRFKIEVTSLYDIFFQHHDDIVAIT